MFCPLLGMEVCVGLVFFYAGIEGWGDRHGRTPGNPQTWMEIKRENGKGNKEERKKQNGF